jgi:hypothetical protein
MSYAMGWWDFVDSDTPQIIHRYTGERIVRSGPLGDGLAPPGEPWFRFDYQSAGLNYPLAVRWAPERGEIVIDHNRSAQLWRQSGAADQYPHWGTYARVDDLAADAFWCWPGIVDIAIAQMRGIAPWNETLGGQPTLPRAGEPLLSIFRLGGYANRVWHENFVIEDVLDLSRCRLRGEFWAPGLFTEFGGIRTCHDLTDTATFRAQYGQTVQMTNRLLLAPDYRVPGPWKYARRDGLKPDEAVHRCKQIWPYGGRPPPADGSRFPGILVSEVPPHVVSDLNSSIVAIVGDTVPRGHSYVWHWTLESWNGDRRGLSANLHANANSCYLGGPLAGPRYATAFLSVEFRSEGKGEITLGPSRNCYTIPAHDAAPILIRDMVDAFFAWRDVGILMADRRFGWHRPGSENETFDRFDLVAITSRFVGGRPVVGRGQLAYFC